MEFISFSRVKGKGIKERIIGGVGGVQYVYVCSWLYTFITVFLR